MSESTTTAPVPTDMLGMVVQTLSASVTQANAIAEQILAATTDRTKRVHELANDSETTDEKVKAYQTWREQTMAAVNDADEKIRAYISENLSADVSEDQVNALKEQYKTLKDQSTSARKFVTTLPGYSDETLKGVPDLKSLRGGTSGSGEGGKRPRIAHISYAEKIEGPYTEVFKQVDDKEGNKVNKTNMTLAAQALSKLLKVKVSTVDLQQATFAEAGTDDLSEKAGKEIVFAYSKDNSKNVFVKVQPADKADEATEAAESEDEAKDEADATV